MKKKGCPASGPGQSTTSYDYGHGGPEDAAAIQYHDEEHDNGNQQQQRLDSGDDGTDSQHGEHTDINSHNFMPLPQQQDHEEKAIWSTVNYQWS